ncbi:nuclear transport factor 2 family protein [Flavobacterium sp.]|uniref:nuclear transport factor 2 family protein n=1 Tax=Flavobacterium sp. TaxID=239 RepID=UPI00286E6B2A|nr:nuclear transport factor 2 family protein [Flavobacterium sp.]
MQRVSLCLIPFLCFVFSTNAQNKTETSDNLIQEKKLIEKTIETYFDGWMTGDSLKLGKTMHATCNLKNIKDNQVIVIDRKNYLGRFKLRPKIENTKGKIVTIDVTANIASAKCEIETPQRLFTDYFNMMKINNEWFIVDKISTNIEKGKKQE